MASVTIPGAAPDSPIVETFGNQANLQLALQIRDALVSASAGGVLGVTVPGPGNFVPPPPAALGAGGINELVINVGGDYTIPAGSAGAPDYVVVIDPATAGGVTIYGAQNSSILGGNAHVTIVDPDTIVLGEGAGNATVTINGIGDVLAGNNLNDTLTAAGFKGSIAGGTGTNLFRDLGGNDTISAQGQTDTIFGGPNSATIQLLGASIFNNGTDLTSLPGARNALVVGGNGALTVTDAGTRDTITGGTITGGNVGALAVTLSGSAASVVGATFGPLFVTDNGTSDTITAGGFGSFTSVTAATSAAFVQGGAGLLNFVGGAGSSTIIGGSGNATVFGGTGLTSMLGGAGSAVTYVNTTPGALRFDAGTGAETIDASLSKGSNTLFGGHDTAGHNLLIAGTQANTLNAGSGADTLVGGGGPDIFNFMASLGGAAVNDVITNFSANDHVSLVGYISGTAFNAINAAVTAGGSTTITLPDNTRITFTGVTDSGALFGGHVLAVPPIG